MCIYDIQFRPPFFFPGAGGEKKRRKEDLNVTKITCIDKEVKSEGGGGRRKTSLSVTHEFRVLRPNPTPLTLLAADGS